jgi:hypothetical protein
MCNTTGRRARVRRPGGVTAAQIVAGHVRLDISCLDLVYLNGYVAKLETLAG